MTLRAPCAAAVLAFVTVSSPLHGQAWESVAPGMRISIRVVDSLHPGDPGRNAVVGTVLHHDSTSFYLRVTSADTLRVSRASITRLAVSKGRSRVRSAVTYALFEGALFSLLVPASHKGTNDFYRSFGAGALVGGTIGAALPGERWRRVKR